MTSEVTAQVPSVLLVDDTPANLLALRAVLTPLDVRLVEASSGEEALRHLAHETFAVALLDVQMPTMDGFELARRLRASPEGRELPIIFLTAIHRDEEYARRGYASGAADYITKPFDVDVLRARVRAFVDLFHQRERLRERQVGERTRERDDAMRRLAELLESERAARKEAEIANHAKDEFLATVSHELRTPLNAILGWAVIARRKVENPEVEAALATIERNARAQMRIIEDMLDVGRIISGKLRLEIAPVKVADAVDGAAQAVRPAADAKGVKLDIEVDEDVATIGADADRLQQIIWNVLSNAIKFTPSGGSVHLKASRNESEVVIRVTDTGQGVPPQFLSSLFERFRQADGSTTRRHGGLGLGLAIVRQLVDAHGGTVHAQSDGNGKGATFTITLPARSSVPAPLERTRSSRPGPRPVALERPIRLDGLRVLVVDDDEDARNLIERVLADEGALVSCASSAVEGLRAVGEVGPDVIVSDIGMPEMDGYALIHQIRSLPADRGGQTPAIALTAYARVEDSERAIERGFQAHLTKPIDPDKLVALVARICALGAGTPARASGGQ